MTSLRSKGFTLIEVLISVLILVFGIVGAATLYIQSLGTTQSEFSRSTANQIAIDIAERIRSNVDPANKPLTLNQFLKGGTGLTTQAQNEINAWTARVKTLPGGNESTSLATVIVCRSANPDQGKPNADKCATNQTTSTDPVTIKIWWAERTTTSGSSGNKTTFVDPSSASAPDRPGYFMVVGL